MKLHNELHALRGSRASLVSPSCQTVHDFLVCVGLLPRPSLWPCRPRYFLLHLSSLDGCRTFVWHIPQRTHHFACVSQENQDRQKIRLKTAATVDQTKNFSGIFAALQAPPWLWTFFKSSETATAAPGTGTGNESCYQ